MIELAKHIEVLLLENDCVIIPGLGGFIAYYSSARYIEKEDTFLPPLRTIGFNPQLKMNDGLLVQSYMQAYDTDFADATRRVEKATGELIRTLAEEGTAEIHGIGKINQTVTGLYIFEPHISGLLTPYLYGLSSFSISRLQTPMLKTEEKKTTEENRPAKNVYELKINRSVIRHVAAAAAAILIFFSLSTPVENTYIEEDNYAMIGPSGLFENIKNISVNSTLIKVSPGKACQKPSKGVKISGNGKSLKPVSVRTEKVPVATVATNIKPIAEKAPETQTVTQPEEKKYHIIVASVGNRADAQRMVDKLKSDGHASASIIERDNKVRVCLLSLSNQSEAYQTLSRYRQNDSFKDAWLLTTK